MTFSRQYLQYFWWLVSATAEGSLLTPPRVPTSPAIRVVKERPTPAQATLDAIAMAMAKLLQDFGQCT